MYTEIIVPLDGGEFSARALPIARALATRMDAPLRLVGFAVTASHATDLRAALAETAGAVTDVRVSWRVEKVEDVVTAIVKELAGEPGALICMSSVGRAHGAPVLGSVAEGILKEAFGPVLLVGPNAGAYPFDAEGPFVICTDGSDTSKSVLPIAAQWAITFPLQPWVVSVNPIATPDAGDRAVADLGNESAHVHRIAHQLEVDIGRAVQYEVLHDKHPAHGITEFARGNHAALIAISTHGATGLRRVALGSVAMAVVHHASCPVLAYRPPHLVGEQ